MDTVAPEVRSRIMSRIHSRDTKPERLLRSALHRAGFRFRVHANLPGRTDIILPRRRLAVFVDGCFWHGCPDHYREPGSSVPFWREKVRRNMERDRKVDAELAALGWKVLRLWEHEVMSDTGSCLGRVRRSLA